MITPTLPFRLPGLWHGECDTRVSCAVGRSQIIHYCKQNPRDQAPYVAILFLQGFREHNDANILALGERVIGPGLALDIVKVWLESEFSGGRHERRLKKIAAIESGYAKGE